MYDARGYGKERACGVGPTQVQLPEPALEEQTCEPHREIRTAFEEEDGRKMGMTGVAFLGRDGSFERPGRRRFLFFRDRRCWRVFLNHSRAHGSVGGSVDQNKAASCSVT